MSTNTQHSVQQHQFYLLINPPPPPYLANLSQKCITIISNQKPLFFFLRAILFGGCVNISLYRHAPHQNGPRCTVEDLKSLRSDDAGKRFTRSVLGAKSFELNNSNINTQK